MDIKREILTATGHNFVDGKCENCGKLEKEPTDEPAEDNKPGDDENTDEDKKPGDDDTTADDNKLPQTGIGITVLVLAIVLTINAIKSGIMLRRNEN